ncbi:MAG: hypothetical protein IJX17_02335, partial [Clostridia bacterium]|nr:hypothetical protein [Clostridia bacterium]
NSVGDFKNATNGQKTIYFKITASGYNDTYGLGYLTINKVSLKVKIGDLSGTYGDIPNVDGVSYDIIDGSLVFGESIKLNFNTNATKLSSVGEYKIFGELDKSENNYTVTFEDGKYNINKKSLVVKVNDITGIYGELSLSHNDYTVDKNHGDIVNNDDLGVTLIYSTTTFDTGIYDITFTWTNNNYDVTFEKGTLTINKRQVYIVINNSSSTYGEKIVLKGKGEGYLITNGSFVNDDETICDFKITTTATSFSDVNGAGYIISSQYNEMKNYDIYVTNGTYTVLKRVIDFKANDSSSAYGDDIKLNGYTITSGSFKNDDLNLANISVLTDATSLSNYGSYDITFNYENLNNYTFNFINGKYEILKRVVKYKIYDSLSYYGENVVKNDYEIIEGNFIGDDENLCDFDINFSITNRTVSGEYKVKAVYNSLDNYEIVCDDGKYQVLKRKIKLQINNHYGTYGDEISLKAYEIINGSFIDEDIKDFSINLSTTATITSDIGSYEINGTCKSMQNYEFYIEKGIYIINPRQVQIKLLNQSGIYGYAPALEPIYEVTYGSIVNNDDLILSLSTCADSNSSVGEYIITGKSNNKNYDCIITLGTYVVGKREIKIELLSQKAPHLGRFEIDQNAYKIVYGTVLTDDKLNVSINSDYKKTSFWSEYSINATYDNKNYDVVFVNASNSLDENNSSDDGSQSIATLKVEISIYDGLILLAILIIIIFIIVFICKATSRKKKKNKKKKGTKKKSSKKTSSNQKKKSSSKKSNKK